MGDLLKYAKNYVWLVCTKIIDGQTQYLIYTRAVDPFLGCQGFPAGKIDWGETVTEAAVRELREETGLTGAPVLKAMIHFIFNSADSVVIQDEFLYVTHVSEPSGELISSHEGQNAWVPETELLAALKKPFVPLEYYSQLMNLIADTGSEVKFLEFKHLTQDY